LLPASGCVDHLPQVIVPNPAANPPMAVSVTRQQRTRVVQLMTPGHPVGTVQWVAVVTSEFRPGLRTQGDEMTGAVANGASKPRLISCGRGHDRRRRAATWPAAVSLALRRADKRLQPRGRRLRMDNASQLPVHAGNTERDSQVLYVGDRSVQSGIPQSMPTIITSSSCSSRKWLAAQHAPQSLCRLDAALSDGRGDLRPRRRRLRHRSTCLS
jgi:hypothetical protein